MALKYDYTKLDTSSWTQDDHNIAEKFLLDDVFYRSNKNYGRKQNRDFVSDRISSGAGDGSLDSQTIDPSGKKTDQKIDSVTKPMLGKNLRQNL